MDVDEIQHLIVVYTEAEDRSNIGRSQDVFGRISLADVKRA
jgi:hypothetical protein